MQPKSRSIGALAAVSGIMFGLLAGIGSVTAHHSVAMFDHARNEVLTGTVKELRWVNPHVNLLVFGVLKEGEEPTDWLLEMASPSILSRLGWSRTIFKPGDQVRVNIHPLLNREEHGGTIQKITSIETGKTLLTNILGQEHEPE